MRLANLTKAFLTITAIALLACSSTSSSKKGDGLDGSGLSESDLNAQRDGRFGDGRIPLAEGEGPFRAVNFDYDSSSLDGAARQNVEYNAQIMEQNPQIKVQLEGHCDERGTAEYNLALGQRRAQSVMDALLSMGVSADRLSTISYGEEVPLDPGTNEAAFAKNRRVNFSGYTERQ
jgi:peptidoglycan-associated lipoprotein